jgi:RNA polymerase sigma-70 factor (ECF subfamily)
MTILPSEPEGLLDLARAGNGPALGQLLEAYRSYLALLARLHIDRGLQDKVDASDVVQETFLAAHDRFAQFRGTSEHAFLAWLRQILASRLAKVVRHYRGTRRRDVRRERRLMVELEQSSARLDRGFVTPTTSPSQRAIRREQGALLAAALEQLPADYREVLVLHHLQGLSWPEVAGRLGRSLDSVKNLWVRALARLRGVVGETR